MDDTGNIPEPKRHQRRRAVLRIVLGQLQIIGATVGLLLLLGTGVSGWTAGVITGTGLISLVSWLLFRDRPA